MNQAWVFVWLAGEPAHAEQLEHLQTWAASKQIELIAPKERVASAEPESSGATATHIEDLIDRARVAKDSLDVSAAEEAIAEARHGLDAHPELPQAPWLLAEVSSIAAELAASAGDMARAARHSRAARRLEGLRSPDVSSATAPETSAEDEASALSARESLVRGLRPGDRLFWNGVPVAAEPPRSGVQPPGAERPLPQGTWRVTLEAGLHHARVLRAGRALWSGWIDVPIPPGGVELPVPAPLPCSRDDFQPVLSPGWVSTPVACDRWVAVRPAPGRTNARGGSSPAAIDVAWCHRDQCGPFERWPGAAAPAEALAATPQDDGSTGVPWWGYALIGTAVSATATILILSVTHRERTERPVWIYGGVQ